MIAVAGADKIAQVLQQARDLSDSLAVNDLLIIPVVYPSATAPSLSNDDKDDNTSSSSGRLPASVALPVGNNWRTLVDQEAQEALKQDVNVEQDGFCVILKKNGRIGQRTKGIFLQNMVADVLERSAMGMDIKNI